MKGSADRIDMTLNIAGEFIQLNVPFDDQDPVREAEREVKNLFLYLRKKWPDFSDKKILAMAAYQFAKERNSLKDLQDEALEAINLSCNLIDNNSLNL